MSATSSGEPTDCASLVRPMLARFLQSFRRPPVPLVLYTRADCCLCDDMLREIRRARLGRRIELSEVDIAQDPELEARWGRSIPVLTIGGRLAFKGRATAGEIVAKFERLGGEWERARSLEGALAGARRRRSAAGARSGGRRGRSDTEER